MSIQERGEHTEIRRVSDYRVVIIRYISRAATTMIIQLSFLINPTHYGPRTKRRRILGTLVPNASYCKAPRYSWYFRVTGKTLATELRIIVPWDLLRRPTPRTPGLISVVGMGVQTNAPAVGGRPAIAAALEDVSALMTFRTMLLPKDRRRLLPVRSIRTDALVGDHLDRNQHRFCKSYFVEC
jgi:hypothetical protein